MTVRGRREKKERGGPEAQPVTGSGMHRLGGRVQHQPASPGAHSCDSICRTPTYGSQYNQNVFLGLEVTDCPERGSDLMCQHTAGDAQCSTAEHWKEHVKNRNNFLHVLSMGTLQESLSLFTKKSLQCSEEEHCFFSSAGN